MKYENMHTPNYRDESMQRKLEKFRTTHNSDFAKRLESTYERSVKGQSHHAKVIKPQTPIQGMRGSPYSR